jgi:hypothetical protein
VWLSAWEGKFGLMSAKRLRVFELITNSNFVG